ncbi:MAG: hypothetical protein A2498_02205 [Lentisphaerae bacterium RIFOXYC12_FULL_60_16]|nr:MAG: hypothetical protein A2498_02205 [Lentisphaerae bacterium RIFOXYC12_FULL_60_16]
MNDTSQFDARFKLPPVRTDNPGVQRRARVIEHQAAQSLARIARRPPDIAWFESTLNTLPAGPADLPWVGYFCNLVPPELIEAFGARAVRLDCGNAALVQTGEEVLSGEICPLAKSSFARFLDPSGPLASCRALILPASCDAKRKLAEVLSDYVPTFILNLPTEQDAGRYLDSAARELERAAAFLAGVLGVRLSRRSLRAAIETSRQRAARIRELDTLRTAEPGSLSARDAFLILQASFTGIPPAEWNRRVDAVLAWMRAFVPARERLRPRLVLTGAPIIWPNFKVLNLIEECGADIVGDTLCTGMQAGWDPVQVDEPGLRALWRALAARYTFAAPCPCFVSQGRRINRILELTSERHAHGVVHYGLRLCPLFDMESYRLNRILRQRGIPFLNLRTDYSLEDTEQLRVRLEAFLETVEGN